MALSLTYIRHRVDGEARDPVRDEARVDEVEHGVEGVPKEVPMMTETPSAPRRSTKLRSRPHDAPRSDSMHIAHLRIPPKRAVLVILRRLVRDAPQSVRDDDEHMHLRYDVDCPARDHILSETWTAGEAAARRVHVPVIFRCASFAAICNGEPPRADEGCDDEMYQSEHEEGPVERRKVWAELGEADRLYDEFL